MAKICPTDAAKVPAFLQRVLPQVERVLGARNRLAQMVRDCLEGQCADKSLEFITLAALNGLPPGIQGSLLGGWVPDEHPSSQEALLDYYAAGCVARVLDVRVHAPDSLDDPPCVRGDVHYVLRHTKAPVTVEIADGTTKEEARAMLTPALEWIDSRWEHALSAAGDKLLGILDRVNPAHR
jgi:hypothetical protein